LSLLPDELRKPFRRDIEHMPGEWDDAQESADRRAATKRAEETTGRAQRVIKHPLFRAFNASQAEEYLGPQSRGDIVIRPSSKGLDHLTITWKVADTVFQHIDVLELDKENEFSVGRTLKIGGKYTYSDLDELIVNHVKAMARKVEEIMLDERYQTGSKAQTGMFSCSSTLPTPTGTQQQNQTANASHRTMAHSLHGSQPQTRHVCLLSEPRIPRLLLPLLHGERDAGGGELEYQGRAECV
jgi:transcription elongation factor SPT6